MCLFNLRGPKSMSSCIGDEADVAVAAALTAPLLRGLHACSSPEELEELLALFSILPAQHAQELLGMPAGDRADFVSFMRDMTLGEKRELVMTSAALLPVGALLQLLRSPPPATCTLCAFKRVHTIDYMLQQNQDPFSVRARAQHDAAESELQPFTSDLFSFEHREPRDRPSVLHWLGLLESHARVFFAGTHSVDTATVCAACKVQVFGFMMHLGNDRELFRAIGGDRLRLLELQRMCERARASWWAWEEQQTQLAHTLQLVRTITKAIRRRKSLIAREEAARAHAAELARLAEQKTNEKHELIMESLDRGEKWKDQNARETAAALAKKTLFGALQYEMDYGVREPASQERWRPHEVDGGGMSVYLREVAANGMPLTADQAAVTFGTYERFVRDDSSLVDRWKVRAINYERTAHDRREYQQRLLDVTRRTQFTADCTEWREGSQSVEDRRTQRLAREKLQRERMLREREEEKRRLAALREELGHEAVRRRAEEAREIEAMHLLKQRELRRETKERWQVRRTFEQEERAKRGAASARSVHARARAAAVPASQMTLAETKQRSIDRFWGQSTELERRRREEEIRRRIFEVRFARYGPPPPARELGALEVGLTRARGALLRTPRTDAHSPSEGDYGGDRECLAGVVMHIMVIR